MNEEPKVSPEFSTHMRRLSAMGKEGIARLKEDGRFTGRAPIGYRNTRDEFGWPTIVPVEPEATIVRQLHVMRAEGRSVRAITRYATEAGLRGRSGRPLSLAGIHGLLRCPTYRGFVQANKGKLVRGTHEAII